jgi:hypothetical protein
MPTFSYTAIEVQQRPDSRPFYLMQCPAVDILQWAAVPRKKQDFQLGYQRALNERYKAIKDYLEFDASNIIPSAVLIAIRGKAEVSPCNAAGCGFGDVKRLELHVPEDLSEDDKLRFAFNDLKSRLSKEELQLVMSSEDLDSGDESLELNDDESPDSPAPPDSYLTSIARQFRTAIETPQDVPVEIRANLLEYASLLQLPGMILDGQHRVYGAKLFNKHDVRLPVVVIPDASLSEQAFHFYVVNNKARPLTPTELRGTISTSLSNREIEDLYSRFKQAGVSADSARWTTILNTRPGSPFEGHIDFGLGQGFLKENAMFQVVSKFLRPKRAYRAVFAGVSEWEDDDYKMLLFFSLWQTIRDRYPSAWNSAVASQKGQILMKATMLVLQEYLLDQFAGDMPKRMRKGELSPVSTVDEFTTSIRDELTFLPEEFFTKKWNRTDIDTSDGRTMLKEQISKVVQNLGKNVGNMQLFQKSKSDSAT